MIHELLRNLHFSFSIIFFIRRPRTKLLQTIYKLEAYFRAHFENSHDLDLPRIRKDRAAIGSKRLIIQFEELTIRFNKDFHGPSEFQAFFSKAIFENEFVKLLFLNNFFWKRGTSPSLVVDVVVCS